MADLDRRIFCAALAAGVSSAYPFASSAKDTQNPERRDTLNDFADPQEQPTIYTPDHLTNFQDKITAFKNDPTSSPPRVLVIGDSKAQMYPVRKLGNVDPPSGGPNMSEPYILNLGVTGSTIQETWYCVRNAIPADFPLGDVEEIIIPSVGGNDLHDFEPEVRTAKNIAVCFSQMLDELIPRCGSLKRMLVLQTLMVGHEHTNADGTKSYDESWDWDRLRSLNTMLSNRSAVGHRFDWMQITDSNIADPACWTYDPNAHEPPFSDTTLWSDRGFHLTPIGYQVIYNPLVAHWRQTKCTLPYMTMSDPWQGPAGY